MFTDMERDILAQVQDGLPLSLTPYADIAVACGANEQVVIDLLERLLAQGVIRRFGAVLRHHKAGFRHNIMVAWETPPEMSASDIDAAGAVLAAHPLVSHCYLRPAHPPDWPYSLFSMLHGRDEAECREAVRDLCERSGLTRYACLSSLKELKKTSMRYF